MMKFTPICTSATYDPESQLTTVSLQVLDGNIVLFTSFFRCDPEDAPRAGDSVEIEILV